LRAYGADFLYKASLCIEDHIKLRQERHILHTAPDGSSDEYFNIKAINITRPQALSFVQSRSSIRSKLLMTVGYQE
jgi:hypothetical protein